MKNKTSATELSKVLGISKSRSLEAILKAQLTSAIIKAIKEENLTHTEVAIKSKLPRTAVTGIISGSLQKVTIDRLLRLAEALGLSAKLVIKKAS